MRKVLLFISTMLLAVTVSAKEIEIGSATSNIIAATINNAGTEDGDVIVLTDVGPYVNHYAKEGGDDYTKLAKNITIKAADGLESKPVIKFEVPFQGRNGKSATFIGIKFDGASLSAYGNYFHFNDANDNSLEFKDCEFTGISKYIIDIDAGKKAASIVFTDCYLHNNSSRGVLNRGTLTSLEISDSHFAYFTGSSHSAIENYSTASIGTLAISGSEFDNNAYYVIYGASGTSINTFTIDNCYFHNNTRSAVYVNSSTATQACNSLTVENSTFADVSGEYNVIDFRCPAEPSFTANAALSVDHCTFFKHPKRAIYWEKSSELDVRNCIFAQPSAIDAKSVECAGGSITNCLSYNSNGYSSVTLTGNLTGNPYFVNIESGSYDFTTASFSPAHNAGTDTKTLGDYNRWTSEDSAHPTTKNLTAGANLIKAAIEAAWPGDNIVLAAGEYTQGGDYTIIDKNIVLKAATSTAPVVKFTIPMKIQGGARAEFKGLKFDMTGLHSKSWYEHLISVEDASDGNKLIFDNCELYNDTMNNSVICCASTKNLDSLNISNCKFYDIKKSCIYLENPGLIGLSIANSTFNNISTVADSYYAGVIDARTTTGKIRIDHCTFYDCLAMSIDYAAIKLYSSDGIVSNSIFAMSSSTDAHRTIWGADGGGTKAKNCLVYNYTNDSNVGMRSAVTKTDCFAGNPLFTDAAEGDFSYPGNWSTGNVSPARKAGTDGSDLGDANWYTDEVVPSTDFEDPYSFASNIALLSGNIGLNGSNHIQYTGSGAPGTATWKIHVEQACTIRVAVNMESGSNSGHKFTIEVRDEEKNLLTKGSVTELATSYSDGDIALFGRIVIPAADDYYIQLLNSTSNSGAKVEGVTFTYAGGNTQDIPTSLYPADAVLSDSAWVEGSPEYINFKKFGDAKYNTSEWAKWRVNVTTAGLYTFTANVTSDNGQYYGIYVLSSDEASTIGSKEGSSDLGTGDRQFSTSPIELSAGEYVVKIVNRYSNSRGRVLSIDAIYEGGTVVDLPATLNVNDAILSPGATCSAGVIYVSNWSTGWVKWRTHVAETEDLYYDIKLSVLSNVDNGHTFSVAIYEDEDEDPVTTVSEGSWSDASGTLNLGRVTLKGNTDYVFKVTNGTSGSTARITGAACEYAGGKKIAVPGTLYCEDALLEKTKLTRLENGDIRYGDNGTAINEYIWWKTHIETGTFNVVLNIPNAPNSHQFEVKVYEDITDEETVVADITETKTSSAGMITVASTIAISTEKDYYVKVINTTNYSQVTLRSVTIAPTISIDEAETDIDAVIGANDGNTVNAQLTRSFTAGMYNTICLPFAVSATELARVFPGAVVKELSSSSIDEGDFVLNLNFDAASSMAAGKPYLIKPAANVVNPKFIGVTIDKTENPSVTSRANFVGKCVKTSLTASEDLLYLGQENQLYFLSVDYDMPGLRGWFVIHDLPEPPAGSPRALRGARIVEREDVVTEVHFVDVQNTQTSTRKEIKNGNLFIIRGNEVFNVQGQRVK